MIVDSEKEVYCVSLKLFCFYMILRLQPVRLRSDDTKVNKINELKNRLFFKICLEDGDFITTNDVSSKPPLLGLAKPLNAEPSHLMVS